MMEYSISDYINLTWLYWIVVTIYGITILSIVAIVLSENRNPVKSLAWVTVLLLLPAVGLVLYVFFWAQHQKHKHDFAPQPSPAETPQQHQDFRFQLHTLAPPRFLFAILTPKRQSKS